VFEHGSTNGLVIMRYSDAPATSDDAAELFLTVNALSTL
jgi:hypothetical protein